MPSSAGVLTLADILPLGPLQGIFVDADGFVAEGPNMNIACLLKDGTLVVRCAALGWAIGWAGGRRVQPCVQGAPAEFPDGDLWNAGSWLCGYACWGYCGCHKLLWGCSRMPCRESRAVLVLSAEGARCDQNSLLPLPCRASCQCWAFSTFCPALAAQHCAGNEWGVHAERAVPPGVPGRCRPLTAR